MSTNPSRGAAAALARARRQTSPAPDTDLPNFDPYGSKFGSLRTALVQGGRVSLTPGDWIKKLGFTGSQLVYERVPSSWLASSLARNSCRALCRVRLRSC